MAFERKPFAEMAEWLKAHDWKSCDAGMYPEVQILFSAPRKTPKKRGFLLFSGHFRPFLHFCPSLAKVLFFTRFLHLPHFLPHFSPLKKALISFICKAFPLFALPHFLPQNDAFFIIMTFFRRRRRPIRTRACI